MWRGEYPRNTIWQPLVEIPDATLITFNKMMPDVHQLLYTSAAQYLRDSPAFFDSRRFSDAGKSRVARATDLIEAVSNNQEGALLLAYAILTNKQSTRWRQAVAQAMVNHIESLVTKNKLPDWALQRFKAKSLTAAMKRFLLQGFQQYLSNAQEHPDSCQADASEDQLRLRVQEYLMRSAYAINGYLNAEYPQYDGADALKKLITEFKIEHIVNPQSSSPRLLTRILEEQTTAEEIWEFMM